MGSIFVKQPDEAKMKIKGFGGKEYDVPFYLQFVPGYAVEVVHSTESLRYTGESSINTIIALPHAGDKLVKTRASAGEEYRYYPLLRTMNDVPSKGDPVLLCTIGKIKYYLGPLNTNSNNPTWNDDPSFKPEILLHKKEKVGRISARGIKGQSENFNKEVSFQRLTKTRKKELDYGSAIRETTGDTIIEGRHGNSLRIGSRSNNPYIFISNGRNSSNKQESLGDGGTISITSNGTLQQHFGGYNIGTFESSLRIDGYILASDNTIFKNGSREEPPVRSIGKLVSSINNDQDVQELIYDYSGNQMFLDSDRITINSKLDDIYLSSNKDIHIGTKENVTISTNKNLIIESEKTYLGDFNKNTMDNMVLGKKVQKALNGIIGLIKEVVITTQLGPQSPMPLPSETTVTSLIDDIISTKHFIEENK